MADGTANVNSGSGIPVEIRTTPGGTDQQVVAIGVPDQNQVVPADQTLGLRIYTTATPVVMAQLAGSLSASVTFPSIQNVNLANVATPPATQNVAVVSTPIVSLPNTQVSIQNWQATQQVNIATPSVLNVNLANVATPPTTQLVNWTATPVVMAAIANAGVSVTNFPATQTVAFSPATPPTYTIPWPSQTANLTSVNASATTVVLLTANGSRKQALLYNNSSVNLYLAFAATATTSLFTVKIPANSYFELPSAPMYLGPISGIWDSATGNANITELT